MTPIALDAGCWERVPLPDIPTVKHVFPGFGGRPRAATQPTMASLADEVAASYEGPLDVVGVSLGGMVAQHLTIRHPDRVRSLLTACTGASADPATMAQRAADAETLGMAGVLDVTLRRWFTEPLLAVEPEHPGVAYARRTLLALDPHCFADGWRAIGGHDAVARLARDRGADDRARRHRRQRLDGRAHEGHQRQRAGGPPRGPRRPAHDAPRASGRVRRRARRAPSLGGAAVVTLPPTPAADRGGATLMARLPMLPPEPADEVTADVFESFRREGRDPIALYRVLAHSPLMLRAYAGLARGLRYEASTPRALRELMILRTAQLTASDYEWAHHRAMGAANGVGDEKVRALVGVARRARSSTSRSGPRCGPSRRSTRSRSPTRRSRTSSATQGASATIELVLLAAFYEAVARIIQALGLEVEPAYEGYLGEPAPPGDAA